ncbi:ThiF family adenylyltransferase [Mesorhizobium sp. M0239]|uniref:HesA/MoeB/ThiF family protein n=1 Tax=Mesorhizobium sp. M0239 TaxID=2956924 RepID=UPI0033380DD4
MITLAFAAPRLRELREALRHPALESAAILLCVPVQLARSKGWRLVVREMHIASDKAYVERTPNSVHLSAEFCLPIEKRARLNGWSLVYVHTHPQVSTADFSPVDDASEGSLAGYLRVRCPDVPHLSLLFSRDHGRARVLGEAQAVRVLEVGAHLQVAFDPREEVLLEDRFDRQVLAFGMQGQARLAALKVGIVGLGGTGSLVAQQLAHLGVRNFILVDDDTIEASNLNRVAGALPNDVNLTKKVYVAERMIRGLRPDANLKTIDADVTVEGVARQVIEADLVFNCTDTHASRHVLNTAAYQFLTPVIDMGVSITVDAEMRARLAGHVKMLAPGLACLWCARHLDAGQVRSEMMTEEQRRADPYFQGAANAPQPAVISLNGVVASLAVTMLLSAVAGVPAEPRYLVYDGNRGRTNAIEDTPNPDCNFCGANSTAGGGDMYPLPARRHVAG